MKRWALLLVGLLLAGCGTPRPPAPVSTPTETIDPFAGMQFDTVLPRPAVPSTPVIDQKAPDFLLPGVVGPPHRLSEWRGKPTVVAFWAFWCTTWREVNSGFRTLAAEDDRRCTLVTVDIDCQWKDQLPQDVPYVALMDPGSSVSHVWDVKAVPTIVVIDGKGVLRARWQGYPGDNVLRSAIDRFGGVR